MARGLFYWGDTGHPLPLPCGSFGGRIGLILPFGRHFPDGAAQYPVEGMGALVGAVRPAGKRYGFRGEPLLANDPPVGKLTAPGARCCEPRLVFNWGHSAECRGGPRQFQLDRPVLNYPGLNVGLIENFCHGKGHFGVFDRNRDGRLSRVAFFGLKWPSLTMANPALAS